MITNASRALMKSPYRNLLPWTVNVRFEKFGCFQIAPMSGVMRSLTIAVTTAVNAVPMMTATASSSRSPRVMNSLKPFTCLTPMLSGLASANHRTAPGAAGRNGKHASGSCRRVLTSLVGVALVALAGCGGPAPASTGGSATGSAAPTGTSGAPSAAVPRPAHTVVVVMENHSSAEIIGNPAAPFINQLARTGALFTRSYAITHPSEPNYLALFSGSTQGLADDSCPRTFTAPNLAASLIAASLSFVGYAEDLPGAGSPACSQGEYARKHVPWTDFTNVPASVSQPFTRWPTGDFARLPMV